VPRDATTIAMRDMVILRPRDPSRVTIRNKSGMLPIQGWNQSGQWLSMDAWDCQWMSGTVVSGDQAMLLGMKQIPVTK
jgi:hypothetical protein